MRVRVKRSTDPVHDVPLCPRPVEVDGLAPGDELQKDHPKAEHVAAVCQMLYRVVPAQKGGAGQGRNV